MLIERKNIKSYLLYKNNCFYIKQNDKNLYLDESIFCQIELLNELNDIYAYKKGLILIRDDRNRSILLNIETKREKFLFDDTDLKVSDLFVKYLLFYKRVPYIQGIFNYFTNKIVVVLEDSPIGDTIADDFIIRKNSDKISVTNLQTFKLWKFPISDFPDYGIPPHRKKADIKQIIGIYNNLLWVHIGAFHLIGLDVETGKLIHHIKDIPTFLGLDKLGKRDFSATTIHLNKESGVLKILSGRYYSEINLTDLEGKIKKDFGESWQDSWRIRSCTYNPEEPDRLFFTAYFKDTWPNGYGIFDTEKAEIIWSELSSEGQGAFFNPPQANKDLFAILDNHNTLRIYDRNDNTFNKVLRNG